MVGISTSSSEICSKHQVLHQPQSWLCPLPLAGPCWQGSLVLEINQQPCDKGCVPGEVGHQGPVGPVHQLGHDEWHHQMGDYVQVWRNLCWCGLHSSQRIWYDVYNQIFIYLPITFKLIKLVLESKIWTLVDNKIKGKNHCPATQPPITNNFQTHCTSLWIIIWNENIKSFNLNHFFLSSSLSPFNSLTLLQSKSSICYSQHFSFFCFRSNFHQKFPIIQEEKLGQRNLDERTSQ